LLLPYPGLYRHAGSGFERTVPAQDLEDSQLIEKNHGPVWRGEKDFKASDKEICAGDPVDGQVQDRFPRWETRKKAGEKKKRRREEEGEEKKPDTKPDNSLKESSTDASW